MKAEQSTKQLEQLVTAVSQSNKYRHVTIELISQIGQSELKKRKSVKEAIKATKNKLHQVGAAYQEGGINVDYALSLLQTDDLKAASQTIMRQHASTAERLPILEEFYQTIFSNLPPVRSILDIACGLNPLAIPWMHLQDDVQYTAVDIYTDMIAILNQYFVITDINGQAMAQDVISKPPIMPVDVAFILKTLPVLEMIEKTAASTLLDALNAKYLIISFPLQSLGGRKKGMAAHYAHQFERWQNGRSWQSQRFDFESELVYCVKTGTF